MDHHLPAGWVVWAVPSLEDHRAVFCLSLHSPASRSGPDMEKVLPKLSGHSTCRMNEGWNR